MKQLVTIAIPTYNRARNFLKQSIECALSQSYENLQIIISDNASSDNTPSLVKGYRDKRIRYFRHDFNIGANNNFNFCLRNACGIYFLLLQDDDLIDPDFIKTCMESAGFGDKAGIIRSGTRVINSNGKIIAEYPNRVSGFSIDEFFLGWFSGKTALYLCSTLFNTSKLKQLGGFSSPKNLFQDVAAEARLAAKWGRIDVPEIKASFRKHSGEMTFSARVKDWCRDSEFLLDLLCSLSSEKKALVRSEGAKFFARLNYNKARSVRPCIQKVAAYHIVFRNSGYRHLPTMSHILKPVWNSLSSNIFFKQMRLLRSRIKDMPVS